MSPEALPLQQRLPMIDRSVDPDVVARAMDLLGSPTIANPDAAAKWIHSPVKSLWERMLCGAFSLAASPVVLASGTAVLATDGFPVHYKVPVGFLGEGNRTVGNTVLYKFRSLQKGIDERDVEDPLSTTAFAGTRKRQVSNKDERVHSWVGTLLRQTSADELPQPLQVVFGQIAGVGPRPYTMPELQGLTDLFNRHDLVGDVFPRYFNGNHSSDEHLFPFGFADNYRLTVSRVRPVGGLASLYTATFRKDLTISERLILDYLYMVNASPMADFRILLATFKQVVKKTGAR